jgi:hypothetical protein
MGLAKDIEVAAVAAAREQGIEPAALLAVVEIESAGKPLEADGVTPRFLFERHKFYSELEAHGETSGLSAAVQQGLAHKDWRRATQYVDQDTSKERLALLGRAVAVNRECAHRACSWGLGQTMGFHAEDLGFSSAVAMVDTMKQGGIAAQISCMIGEIRRNHLDVALARRDWVAFARGYNGKRYAENAYDTKLAVAFGKWALLHPPAEDVAQIGDRGALITGYQKRLAELGYAVGAVDGRFGSRTRAAVMAFQAENGLVSDGRIDALTRAALGRDNAKPMPVGERAKVTGDDLAKAGSETVVSARVMQDAGKVLLSTSAVAGVEQQLGLLDGLKGWTAELGTLRGVTDTSIDLLQWMTRHWWLLAVVLGYLTWTYGRKIEWRRVRDHVLGLNLGR